MDGIKSFSIKDIQEIPTNESDEFFYAKICVLSTRPNTHKVLITEKILKRDGKSVLGKWVVANTNRGEVMSHDKNEVIVGIIPKDSKIEFVEDSDGYILMYADAVLSKIYAKPLYDMFRRKNFRNVSVEMVTTDLDVDEFGNTPITGLNIVGITILGSLISGSCPDANMSIVQFSEDGANDFYEQINKNSLKSFAEERKEKLKLVSHPMEKTEYVTSDWDGDKAKHDAIKEKKFVSMAKSIFLKLDDDYKERKIGSLHYPVMGLYDGVWKYNAEGLSSAKAYGEQHDKSVAEKATNIQKKLGLYKEKEQEAEMEEKKEFESESDVIMEKDEEQTSTECQEEKEMSCGDKECSEPEEKEVEETEKDKEMSCGDKEMSEGCDCGEEKEEKEFSLNAYIDSSAMLSMLESETEQNKELAERIVKEMSAIDIVNTILTFAKENDELKKFKEERLENEKLTKLSQIMASVKSDLDTKTFSELQEEGKTLSIDELGGFENKVKAFAYEFSKNNKHQDDEIMRFAGSDANENTEVNDVFNRISKK